MHSLRLATAELMIAMMRADAEIRIEEQKVITKTIRTKFDLSPKATKTIITLTTKKINQTTCYYEFTSLINKDYTYNQKIKVIAYLWEVAFSDSALDKSEEHMVRKIADLIHIAHKDFIDAKLRLRNK